MVFFNVAILERLSGFSLAGFSEPCEAFFCLKGDLKSNGLIKSSENEHL